MKRLKGNIRVFMCSALGLHRKPYKARSPFGSEVMLCGSCKRPYHSNMVSLLNYERMLEEKNLYKQSEGRHESEEARKVWIQNMLHQYDMDIIRVISRSRA